MPLPCHFFRGVAAGRRLVKANFHRTIDAACYQIDSNLNKRAS